MTADLKQGIIAHASGAKHRSAKPAPSASPALASSPPRKDAPNPQQGMADPAAASVSRTACTSPLTVTSLEAAAAAGTAAANHANGGNGLGGVPRVVPMVQPQPERPDAEAMLSGPMAELGLGGSVRAGVPTAGVRTLVPPPPPPPPAEEKKMRLRTPPTEHDNRKLFVGGLPTDVSDHGFLEFFKQFGEVLDSVVMVDRLTKRSRGFGFVTFATEDDANSLLTAVPGKTGYVVINGKQCEVKASTPKVDDGPSGKHHHHHHGGAPGMWRSHPPHSGYRPRSGNGGGPVPPKGMGYPPRGEKQFYMDQEFNGDVDGRNFDEVYSRAQQPQMNAGYQYGRGYAASNNPSVYNYQNVYPAAPSGYAYAGAAVPSSWEASYPVPAPARGYHPSGARYPSGAASGNGGGYADAAASGNDAYGDPYAAREPYPRGRYSDRYGNRYGGSVGQQPAMGYADYGGYPVQREGSPVPAAQGAGDGFEPYGPYRGDDAGGAERFE